MKLKIILLYLSYSYIVFNDSYRNGFLKNKLGINEIQPNLIQNNYISLNNLYLKNKKFNNNIVDKLNIYNEKQEKLNNKFIKTTQKYIDEINKKIFNLKIENKKIKKILRRKNFKIFNIKMTELHLLKQINRLKKYKVNYKKLLRKRRSGVYSNFEYLNNKINFYHNKINNLTFKIKDKLKKI